MPEIKIHNSWKTLLSDEFEKEYFNNLIKFVKTEYKSHTIYPQGKNIFRALDFCPFENVKVVILGQDPYHGPSQANGLCFSVNEGIRKPPSLINIYKEIESDLKIKMPNHGNLENWSKQGILLLNATLTVRANQAGSHQKKGWEEFTDAIINIISEKKENIVFILWGNYAKKKGEIINKNKHLILEAPHPSPLSAHSGFFGSKHFSKTNEYLLKTGKNPINWDKI
ncbi:MAG: uracil-DNA glycosylase [Candidatus Gracilibacteria bacterium]|jgi:uracil-DNA glycosylase|nr:uracil-DNA glycosylase [Candidatus Gracilibacteria bacterium]